MNNESSNVLAYETRLRSWLHNKTVSCYTFNRSLIIAAMATCGTVYVLNVKEKERLDLTVPIKCSFIDSIIVSENLIRQSMHWMIVN